MQLDVRPVFTALIDDVPSPILHGNARIAELVGETERVLETARRLGVRDLGSSRLPLQLHLTADPVAAATPMFVGRDTLLLGVTPIDGRGREFLQRSGRPLREGATWLDVDLGAVVPHEIGHGVVNELVPQVTAPTVQSGAWRTRGFDQRIVEEALADVFAAIHRRSWTMTLGGVPVRDAARGYDHVSQGTAPVDVLNQAREIARGGIDDAIVGGVHQLGGVLPHAYAGLLTPAFAIVERRHGWTATESLFTDVLARLRARDYPIDTPAAARETARAAADLLGRTDDAALEVRRLLMTNGAMG